MGLQLSIPLEEGPKNLALAKAEYSFLVTNKHNGITDGLVWTYDVAGKHTFGYLRPSNTFLIGKSKVYDYTLPFISSENSGGVSSNYVTTLDGGDLIM